MLQLTCVCVCMCAHAGGNRVPVLQRCGPPERDLREERKERSQAHQDAKRSAEDREKDGERERGREREREICSRTARQARHCLCMKLKDNCLPK